MDYCLTCNRYIDKTEAIAYDERGGCVQCESCITDAEIEALEAQEETE